MHFVIQLIAALKICCYDYRQVGVSTVDMPLTSIDIKNDGYTVVLGTTKGKLFIVDLRQGSSPTKVISAHSTSVKCVRFQGNHEPSKVNVFSLKHFTIIFACFIFKVTATNGSGTCVSEQVSTIIR